MAAVAGQDLNQLYYSVMQGLQAISELQPGQKLAFNKDKGMSNESGWGLARTASNVCSMAISVVPFTGATTERDFWVVKPDERGEGGLSNLQGAFDDITTLQNRAEELSDENLLALATRVNLAAPRLSYLYQTYSSESYKQVAVKSQIERLKIVRSNLYLYCAQKGFSLPDLTEIPQEEPEGWFSWLGSFFPSSGYVKV